MFFPYIHEYREVKYHSFKAKGAFEVEAEAVAGALSMLGEQLREGQLGGIHMMSDCSILVEAINSTNQELVPTWQIVEKIAELSQVIGEGNGGLKLSHVSRAKLETSS